MTPHREPLHRPDPSERFEAEVLPLRRELFGAALRLTRNPADADDLVQDSLARAFAAWHRFEPDSNVRAWLHRILHNAFVSGYRRQRSRRRFTSSGDDAIRALYGDQPERAANPVRELLDGGLGDEVAEALDDLGDDYRRVVELADLRGARYKDIAAELGVPIGTVMSRLFRARRQLESKLEDYAASDYGIRRAA